MEPETYKIKEHLFHGEWSWGLHKSELMSQYSELTPLEGDSYRVILSELEIKREMGSPLTSVERSPLDLLNCEFERLCWTQDTLEITHAQFESPQNLEQLNSARNPLTLKIPGKTDCFATSIAFKGCKKVN